MTLDPVGVLERQRRQRRPGVFRDSLEFCIDKREILDDMMKEMEGLARKRKR